MDAVELVTAEEVPNGRMLKVVLTTASAGMLMGAIFWAGATYQRLGSVESHLISIDAQIGHIADIQADVKATADRQIEIQRRVERLEDQVRQLK